MAESAVHRAEERPGSAGPKRTREWEEEPAAKKQPTEENRARLEDVRHRRPSTPPRDAHRMHPSESRHPEEQRRVEDQRRQDELREARPANDGYHPSEAAHHQQNHAPSSQTHTPVSGTPHEKPHPVTTPKEERAPPPPPEQAAASRPAPPTSEPERAARKMDVDEDYDDSGEDDKKAVLANGSAPGSVSAESKTSPTSAGVNGNGTSAPKTE